MLLLVCFLLSVVIGVGVGGVAAAVTDSSATSSSTVVLAETVAASVAVFMWLQHGDG